MLKTDISQFIGFNYDGLNFLNMQNNSLFCPILSPVQFVPEGVILNPRYHTKDMGQFWFVEQITNWINQTNYWNPWQKNDPIPLQFQTKGLTPVSLKVYSCDGTLVSTTSFVSKTSSAIITPQALWELISDSSSLGEGQYFMQVVAGVGGSTVKFISEGLWVKTDWPETLLFEYTNSVNKQAMIFDTGFAPCFRVKGFIDNTMKPKYKGAFYVDQPQDIQILNAIPYETRDLYITGDAGVPDYVLKKISRLLLLTNTLIDGVGYSLDEGAEWEETFIPGNPMKFWKITIRLASNIDGVAAVPAGVDSDASMLIMVDPGAFAPNAGNQGNTDQELVTAIIT